MSRDHPDLQILALVENRGPCVARNAGLARAGTDLVLLVDDDVMVEKATLQRLVEAQARTGAAVVTPRVRLHPEGTVQCDGASAHWLGAMALVNEGRLLPDVPDAPPTPVGAVISACLLVDRRRALDAGGFDEPYFFYLEDLEFGLRMRALGHDLVCAPGAVVHHDRGYGTPGLSFRGAEYPARRAYLTHRNRWLTLMIHGSRATLVLLSPALLAFELASLAFFVSRGWLPHWLHSWRWLGSRRAEIRARRERLRERRQVCTGLSLVEGGPVPLAASLLRSDPSRRLVYVLSTALDAWWRMARRLLGEVEGRPRAHHRERA